MTYTLRVAARYNRQIMSAPKRYFSPTVAVLSVLALNVVLGASFAQTPASPARVDAPDGAPELVVEKNVSNTSVTAPAKASGSVIVEEERVQGRLANAHVRVGTAKGYTIVDPNAGRTDRQPDNAGKRVNPSLWELFRF